MLQFAVLVDGKPCVKWGGDYAPAGEWTARVVPKLPERGYHLTWDPLLWWRPKAELWLAEGEGPLDSDILGVTAFARVRLTERITRDWPHLAVFPRVRAFLAASMRSFDRDADISWAHLGGMDLIGVNLRGANLSKTSLKEARLREAELSNADLRQAELRGADLRGTSLGGADLRQADLLLADLRKADLRGANLRGANLSRTNLRGANLSKADLREANLYGANLGEAILCQASLTQANLYAADLSATDLGEADLSGARRDFEPPLGWKLDEAGVLLRA